MRSRLLAEAMRAGGLGDEARCAGRMYAVNDDQPENLLKDLIADLSTVWTEQQPSLILASCHLHKPMPSFASKNGLASDLGMAHFEFPYLEQHQPQSVVTHHQDSS